MWSASLIDLVKKQPMLYDRSNAGYKSVTKKKLKWKEISAEINNSLGIEITGEACEKKWRQLRDSFTREHKKLTSSASLGSCSTKEWELYRAMYFLTDHLRYKPSGCSSYTDTSNSSIQNSSYSSEPLYIEEEIIVVNADEDVDNSNDNENYDSSEHSPQPAFSSLLPSHHSKATESTISSASVFSTKRSPDCLSRDNFYKRQKSLDCLDEELKNSYEILTETVGTLKGFTKPVEEVDGWLQCMKEAWKEVPVEKRNRCMVDILNIMDKYRNKNTNDVRYKS